MNKRLIREMMELDNYRKERTLADLVSRELGLTTDEQFIRAYILQTKVLMYLEKQEEMKFLKNSDEINQQLFENENYVYIRLGVALVQEVDFYLERLGQTIDKVALDLVAKVKESYPV